MKESNRKWGRTVIKAGFVVLPSALLRKQRELDLDAVDLCILIQLADHVGKAGRAPWVAKRTLARRIGVDPITFRRHIARLEQRGLIRRERRTADNYGRRSNAYHLKPLADALHPLAVQTTKQRQAKRQETLSRRRRGGHADE
jgi:DNA-binding MarR family transcriptional regulator